MPAKTMTNTASKLKFDLAQHKHFKGRCFVCRAKYKEKRGFTFHHLWYLKDEKIYSDLSELPYARELVKLVHKQPERFLLLCRNHHAAVERLSRLFPDKRRRLYDAVRKTVIGKKK